MLVRALLTAQLTAIVTKCKYFHNFNTLSRPLPIRHNLKVVPHFQRFTHQTKAIKCWQCGIERKNISELFCEQCNFIQSPYETQNYFKVFELEENFNLDHKLLTQKYRQMQSVLHPDKFSTRSNQEKDISEEFSSLVNKAYDVLQSPIKRAIHLLKIKGQTIEEGQKVEDPDFLMGIMELNEEVEDADNEEKLVKLKQKNDKEIEVIIEEIQKAFSIDQIDKAKELVIKLKYYNSVSLHINSLMREKGIVE